MDISIVPLGEGEVGEGPRRDHNAQVEDVDNQGTVLVIGIDYTSTFSIRLRGVRATAEREVLAIAIEPFFVEGP